MAATLEIALLRTFVAIENFGGFGRAAEALRISQPTVSQHVRSLEQRLGQPLVEKDGRRSRLTDVGEMLLVEARRIIAVHDEALARLHVVGPQSINIGSVEAAAEQVLPDLLAAMRDAYPERTVRFTIDHSSKLVGAVEDGVMDVGLVIDANQTSAFADRGVDVAVVPLHWYACPRWTPPPPPSPLPLITYVAPSGMRDRALNTLKARGIPVRVAAEAGSMEAVIAAARAGVGVAVLPSIGPRPREVTIRSELPDPGQILLRLIWRRGVEDHVAETAANALRSFFDDRGLAPRVAR
ncbi:LysR substrate-binding domain-containing protein [Micromonospora sp. DT81.3]|uniref:LysR family transcriptional regulator n=1 Tax=Micromonospora sp. DT81.3 TaxID=3416523 RepID=UPI003CF046C5